MFINSIYPQNLNEMKSTVPFKGKYITKDKFN